MMTVEDIQRIVSTTNVKSVTIEESPVTPGRFLARVDFKGAGGSSKSTHDTAEAALQSAMGEFVRELPRRRNLTGLIG